ncbi:MAG: VTT domain-containing protein [Candidatus Pacebacteria bacterium]|nr:VTT domain-containing protein [Candidatus Paceibacterota bacterium]MDD5356913.1 VTT domain-containing protein [Candidatus Paceibacterota bacterium]
MHTLLVFVLQWSYLGIFVVVFAESGFLLGFFLPGDSLLFTAGLLASQGIFNIWILVPLIVIGAILGDSFGYYMGNKLGPKIFVRKDSFFFKQENVEKTNHFYEKYGVKTIILARFVPIVRTFAPIFAGVGGMKYATFLSYNVIGGFLWGAGVTLAGFFLGRAFPGIEHYLTYIIIAIILLSFVPILLEYFKKRTA